MAANRLPQVLWVFAVLLGVILAGAMLIRAESEGETRTQFENAELLPPQNEKRDNLSSTSYLALNHPAAKTMSMKTDGIASPSSLPVRSNEAEAEATPISQAIEIDIASLLELAQPDLNLNERLNLTQLLATALAKHLPHELTRGELGMLRSSIQMLATDFGRRNFEEANPNYERDLLASSLQLELGGAVFAELLRGGVLNSSRQQQTMNDYSHILRDAIAGLYLIDEGAAMLVVESIEPNINQAGYFFEPLFLYSLSEQQRQELIVALTNEVNVAHQRLNEIEDTMTSSGANREIIESRLETESFREALALRRVAHGAFQTAIPEQFWPSVTHTLGLSFQDADQHLQDLARSSYTWNP